MTEGRAPDVPDSVTASDLQVLEAVVELTPRRVNVPAVQVLEHLHQRAPRPSEWMELRYAVLRLERDGLVRSDPNLVLEATPDGQVAVGLLRARRPHSA
jgi:hypothetical protein